MSASVSAPAPSPAWPASEVETLTRVSEVLDQGRPDSALSLLPAGGTPWLRNARGVCLMRLGRPSQALDALRELVFEPVGHAVRADAHPVHLMNYATALLLDGNSDSFWGIFRSARDRSHPAVVRVEASVRRWQARLSFAERLMVALGAGPRPALDIPPGEV